MARPTRPGSTPRPRSTRPDPRTPRREFLAGRNSVAEAVRAGERVRRIFVADSAHGTSLEELVAEAHERGIPVQPVERTWIEVRAGTVHHQGVLADVAPYPYRTLDDLLARADAAGQPPLLLALDSLQDPQNLGTLLRTAQATGAHGVVIPEHRAVAVTPAVARASAGAVEHLLVARVTNLARNLESLKARGLWVYGLAVEGGPTFWEVDWTGPCVVVIGGEGAGLGRLVRETCDGLVRIPMAPEAVQSLNAATAGSIALYEAFRQRSAVPALPPA